MSISIDPDLLDCIFCVALCALASFTFLWAMRDNGEK